MNSKTTVRRRGGRRFCGALPANGGLKPPSGVGGRGVQPGSHGPLLPGRIPKMAVTTPVGDIFELLFERHPVVGLALLANQGVAVAGPVTHQVLDHSVHVTSVTGKNWSG